MSKSTFFLTQFPTETQVEISSARLSDDGEKFIDHDLNIGWAMSVDNSYHVNKKKIKLKEGEHRKDYRIVKTCQGATQCMNSACSLYKVYSRPPIKESLIKSKQCPECQERVTWTQCKVKVEFYFSAKRLDCTMKHVIDKNKGIFHDHGSYSQIHHTQDQQVDNLANKSQQPSIITAAKNSSNTEDFINAEILKLEEGFYEIIMDREMAAEHELIVSRLLNELSAEETNDNDDLFDEFSQIEDDYPDFIISAEMVSSKFCITFSAPIMTTSKLPFDTYPMITGVSTKALCDDYYLCSTVIYVPIMKRHLVIFQAVIKQWTADQFATYFDALFAHFTIKPETFLGMVVDFSLAKREGFLQSFSSSFGFNRAQAMPFLKGCYMQWKKSVQRLVVNHRVVRPGTAPRFISLTNAMQTATVDEIFLDSVTSLLKEFPNSRLWVRWWLRPGVSSTILNFKSLMKQSLKEHETRTTNAIESFHSGLSRLVPTSAMMPLIKSLRFLLQICRRDGRLLKGFFEHGILPYYGKGNKKRKSTKKGDLNEDRAPDSTKSLFEAKKRRTTEENEDNSSIEHDVEVEVLRQNVVVSESQSNDTTNEQLLESLEKCMLEVVKGIYICQLI